MTATASLANGRRRFCNEATMLDHSQERHVLSKRRNDAAFAVLDLLFEQFPNCFVRLERRRRPLKIGIHLDLITALDGAVTPVELGRALGVYTGNVGYLDACRCGVARIDLAGNACGEVSPEHAANASKLWARQKARQAARRAQLANEQTAPAKTEPELKPQSSLAELRAAAQRRKAGAPPQDGGRR
jgi:sRNA-binding protein